MPNKGEKENMNNSCMNTYPPNMSPPNRSLLLEPKNALLSPNRLPPKPAPKPAQHSKYTCTLRQPIESIRCDVSSTSMAGMDGGGQTDGRFLRSVQLKLIIRY